MKLSSKIGVLQLTDHRLRLIVIKTGSANPKVLERIDEKLSPLNDDPELAIIEQAAFVRNAVKKLKNVPAIYMLNTPHEWSVMRLLSVPFKGAKKVSAAVTFELEPYLAIPIDDLMIDHNIVSEVDGKSEVFVIGLQRKLVAEQLLVLREAGVTIEGIGLDIVGLGALTLDTLLKDSSPQAIVIQHNKTYYVAVVHNRALAYVQRIAASQDQQETWAQEIQNAIRAYHANSLEQTPLTRVLCAHFHPDQNALTILEDKLGLPIHSETLGASWAPHSILETEDSSTWLSMIGTGSAAAGGSISISFSQTDADEVATQNPYKLHLAAIAALLVFSLTAHLFITHAKTKNNIAEIDLIGQAIFEEFAATYPADPIAQARPTNDVGGSQSYQAMLDALEIEQSKGANLTPEMFNRPSLLNILKEISTHMPDSRIMVKEINITNTRRKRIEIHVRGETKTATAFATMLDGLEKSNLLEMGSTDRRKTAAGKDSFDIKAYIKLDSSGS